MAYRNLRNKKNKQNKGYKKLKAKLLVEKVRYLEKQKRHKENMEKIMERLNSDDIIDRTEAIHELVKKGKIGTILAAAFLGEEAFNLIGNYGEAIKNVNKLGEHSQRNISYYIKHYFLNHKIKEVVVNALEFIKRSKLKGIDRGVLELTANPDPEIYEKALSTLMVLKEEYYIAIALENPKIFQENGGSIIKILEKAKKVAEKINGLSKDF